MAREKNIGKFSSDVRALGRYEYTDQNRLSARLANDRFTAAILSIVDLKGKKVVDIGCGDGAYTFALLGGKPGKVLGIDAADAAIDAARKRIDGSNECEVSFEAADVYSIANNRDRFDTAVIRGVLHHLY